MDTSTSLSIKVVKAPSSKLRIKTKPVKKVTPELLKLAQEMIKITKAFKDPEGVGLASTQIGRDERFFIAKVGKTFQVFFNPQILSRSKRTRVFFEGCLSIPDHYGETVRPTIITVSYLDKTGKKVIKKLTGITAWIFQHEMDHLNGTLFVDQVLSQKGKMYKVIGKDQAGADIFEEVRLV